MSELAIVGKNGKTEPQYFQFRIGETLKIKATSECATKIRTEFAGDTTSKGLKLYLNGVPMSNLTSSPPIQSQNEKELSISFYLSRDANDDENRKAWDTLLKKPGNYLMTIEPALAIGNNLPVAVQSAQPLQFYIAPKLAIWMTLGIGLAILVVAYYLIATCTKMLRDEGTGYYSLGKSQMAFWGLLVLLAFTGVWILTGSMERIPPQVLILLGISGATGLSAIVIGNGRKSETENNIAKLRKEQQDLQEKQAKDPGSLSVADKDRLVAIPKEMEALSKQLGAGESKGFWRDICDDGNGISFHRLQVVLWTMVLGAIFVRSVAQTMSMPEFSETLLTLMGISNGTYLGFKIPEKQNGQGNITQ